MSLFFRMSVSTIAALTFAFSSVSPAVAKIPPEVMAPYKDYRAALEKNDKAKASKLAYTAWQKAEKLMGDSKTTGDLAFNFANVDPDNRNNSLKLHKQRVTAFKRAIKLAPLYSEDAEGIEIDRRLKLAAHGTALKNIKKGKLVPEVNNAYFNNAEKAIVKYGKSGTTYEADLEALKSHYYNLRGQNDTALVHANKAISIFDNRTDTLISGYLYYVKFFKANILAGKGDKIPAALQYQELMQNLEGDLEPDHPFIEDAFRGWMLTRSELVDAGRLEEAEAAGLCECWPFENYKNKPQPLLRVPPIMPRSARRSGHVDVIFDIDEAGKPFNIKSIYATESMFVAPSIKSVDKWRYSPIEEGADLETRKGIAAKISFLLRNSRGAIIPEKRL